ncbi:MAG: flagellar motor protein MotB [Bacteroidota bacterium]
MKKRKKHSGHENQDRWLLTYSDLITLLLGLFVILYAMSNIDKQKYSKWVVAFGGAFGKSNIEIAKGMGSTGVLDGMSEQLRIEKLLQRALSIEKNNSALSVSIDERGVTVHIQEELLFPSGQSELKGSSYVMLDSLAQVLKKIPNDIRVEGHSDNVPIATAQFPSNWHLSVSRAMNTGYYLIQKHGMNPEKVSVVGYGEFKPVLPNTSEKNRAANRRVDIVILMSQVTQTLNIQKQSALQGE